MYWVRTTWYLNDFRIKIKPRDYRIIKSHSALGTWIIGGIGTR